MTRDLHPKVGQTVCGVVNFVMDIPPDRDAEIMMEEEAVAQAEENLTAMATIPSFIENVPGALDVLSDVISKSQSTLDSLCSCVDKMRIFVGLTEALADVGFFHPVTSPGT